VDELAAYERALRRAGLPLLIEDYSAREDVFTRAVPLLSLVFAIELLGAIDLNWSLAANLAAALGGLAILLGAVAALNRARGRPPFAVPQEVGRLELALFVLVPALLPLIFGGQLTSAAVTALGNAALLLAVYLVVGYGLLSILRWAAARLLGQLATSLLLLARAIPLLLFFALVLFLTTEMWQVFSTIPTAFMVALGAMFAAIGGAFLAVRLPVEVRALLRDAAVGQPLERRQRVNVGLVMFISQALQVLVVSLAVGAFFVAFGLLAVGPEARQAWIGSNGHVLVTLHVFGERAVLTEELLRVAGALAAFSGLYYAIAVLTDATYRAEFLDELTGQLRETFRVRAAYLELRAASGARAESMRL
jgi:hypothetical protein